MADDHRLDPRVPLLLLLSATTGLVDAASVLGLGRVFTANMTGNVVFLGFAAAGLPGFAWISFVVAIAAFLVGALLGGRTAKTYAGRPERRWLLTAAGLETAMLWVAAIAAVGFRIDAPDQVRLYAIIVLTGIAMGFRNATVRQMKVPDLTTTVLTLTLTGLAADSSAAGGASPNWLRRVAAVFTIFVGALVGALLLVNYGLWAPLAAAGVLVIAATLGFVSARSMQATST